MYLCFTEEFDVPISTVFQYFESPSEWGKLYGIVKPGKVLENDWYAIVPRQRKWERLGKRVKVEVVGVRGRA